MLHKINIRKGLDSKSANAHVNYRTQPPPYGYKLIANRMYLSKPEQRICRVVVELMRQINSSMEVAHELSFRGYKNRKGTTVCTYKTVKLIYDRWKDKI